MLPFFGLHSQRLQSSQRPRPARSALPHAWLVKRGGDPFKTVIAGKNNQQMVYQIIYTGEIVWYIYIYVYILQYMYIYIYLFTIITTIIIDIIIICVFVWTCATPRKYIWKNGKIRQLENMLIIHGMELGYTHVVLVFRQSHVYRPTFDARIYRHLMTAWISFSTFPWGISLSRLAQHVDVTNI